jgi:hypothetical protein
MPSKRKNQLPFKAKTMGNYQRELDGRSAKKESKTATEHTSTVTVFRPDAAGNLIAVETVASVFVKPSVKKRRPKIPKGNKSLL